MKIESFGLNRTRMMKHLVAARHSHAGCDTVERWADGPGNPGVLSGCVSSDSDVGWVATQLESFVAGTRPSLPTGP